jgi:hypothetical protein
MQEVSGSIPLTSTKTAFGLFESGAQFKRDEGFVPFV